MSGEPARAQAIPPRRRTVALFGLIAGAALGLDVLSKTLVAANLGVDHPPVRVLGGALYLVETRNSGAAFAVGTGATIVLTFVALAVALVIMRTARRLRSAAWAVALGLILGGAVGNLVDRLLRSPGPGRGRVLDWVSLFSDDGHVWPIFNLADASIVCGAVLAAVIALFGVDLDGNRTGSGPIE